MRDVVARHKVELPETGLEISVLDWGGEGPPALLHHANGFCAAVLSEVALGLRSHFRVFAMDARGHGDSSSPRGPSAFDWSEFVRDAQAVSEWVRRETGATRLGLGLGHSFGGALLLSVAASRPGLFERVVAVDPVILPPMTEAQMAERVENHGLAEAARKRRDRFPSRSEARAHFASRDLFVPWTRGCLDAYVAEGLRQTSEGDLTLKCAGEVEATIFENGHTLGVYDRVKGMTTPVLLLHALRGNFPRAAFEALVARMAPGAASLESLDVGHLVPMEQPEIVVDAALRFCGAL